MLSEEKEFAIAAAVEKTITSDDMVVQPINLITHAVSLLILDVGYAATSNHLRNMADAIERMGMGLEFPNGN